MTKTPSRLLNENPSILGLGTFDLVVLCYVLILSHEVLSILNLELLSFALTAVIALALMQIRLTSRPKIIRDFMTYQLHRNISFKGSNYAPKSS